VLKKNTTGPVQYISQIISEKVEEEDTENKEENGQSESGTGPNKVPKLLLAKSFLPFWPNRKLCIQCRQSNHGWKTIEISTRTVGTGTKNGKFLNNHQISARRIEHYSHHQYFQNGAEDGL
jgi:hypothetical protein